MSSPERFDVVVIGAGLVGLATARALLLQGGVSKGGPLQGTLDLCVLEAEDRPAAHQSGHNSGVIHSGLYYRPGSLKAELCARGRAALFAYCAAKDIAHERCGKLVVATEASEIPALDELERRGTANGLQGIERLGPEGLRAHEPHAAGIEALFVPETGIADFSAVARAFAADVAQAGGEVRLRRAAGRIHAEPDGFRIETPAGEVRAGHIVNCAGAQSDRVARRAGLAPAARIVPFRGEYKHLTPDKRGLVRNLIYPVPDPRFPFLGVHFTRGTDGAVEAGPNAVLATHRHGYRRRDVSLRDLGSMLTFPGFWRMAARHWRTGLGELQRSLSHRAFTTALQRLLPELQPADLVPGGAGVRAQALDRDGTLVDDFRIERGPRAFHVLCAPSPAATASIAIGAHLAREAAQHFGFARELAGDQG